MSSVVLDDLWLECGRGKEWEVWPHSQFRVLAPLLHWAVGNPSCSQVHSFPSENRKPAFPALQRTHVGQRDRVWQHESSLLAVLELGQWKTQWVDCLHEVGEAHPPRGTAASFLRTFNVHTLWDHARNGWHWPKETRRGGLINWGVRHSWLPTQRPSPSPLPFFSDCGQPPTAEANDPQTHFPGLLCI